MADPFIVSCPAHGKGRWADTRNWVFDFDADLDAGIRCRFTLKPALKSSSGALVEGRGTFGFETGGPAIMDSRPRDGWEQIDEGQVFLLRLDAQARQASIEAHAYCAVDGLSERIPVRVLTGAEREPGSTLKPFLHELALERRYLTAASLLADSPISLDTASGVYIPQSYPRPYGRASRAPPTA